MVSITWHIINNTKQDLGIFRHFQEKDLGIFRHFQEKDLGISVFLCNFAALWLECYIS